MKNKPTYIGKVYKNRLSEQEREARRVPIWAWILATLSLYWFIVRWIISLPMNLKTGTKEVIQEIFTFLLAICICISPLLCLFDV